MNVLKEFEQMHLHHIESQNMTETYCKQLFRKKMKKWKKRNRSYSSVCKSKTDCRYVIKVFGPRSVDKIEFAHEVRMLQILSDHKVDFIPRVHTAFLCGNYRLLVQDRWKGDIIDLLFAQKTQDVERVFQKAQRQAMHILMELHRLGMCYGKKSISFSDLIYCDDLGCPDVMKSDDGFHLGLQDWRYANRSEHKLEMDMHPMNMLFMEISVSIHAQRHRQPIPDYVSHNLRHKFQQLQIKI